MSARFAAERLVCPYGWLPYSNPHERAISATAPAMSRSCVSRCSLSWRTPREVGFPQRRADGDVGEQRQRGAGEPAERGHREQRRIRADVGIELRAEPGDAPRVSRSTTGLPLPSSSMSSVIAASPSLSRRIVRGASPDQQHERDDRYRGMANRPPPEASSAGKKTCRSAESGMPAPGRAPATATGRPSCLAGPHPRQAHETSAMGRIRAGRRSTRPAAARRRARPGEHEPGHAGPAPAATPVVNRPVARKIAIEERRIADEHVCTRSADRTCRRSRRRSGIRNRNCASIWTWPRSDSRRSSRSLGRLAGRFPR